MTLHPTIHGRAGSDPNKALPEAAPRGFDLYRLDCAVDALRGADLSHNDRAELARIAANLADIMEPMQ